MGIRYTKLNTQNDRKKLTNFEKGNSSVSGGYQFPNEENCI